MATNYSAIVFLLCRHLNIEISYYKDKIWTCIVRDKDCVVPYPSLLKSGSNITLTTMHNTYFVLRKRWYCNEPFAALNEDCLPGIFFCEAGLHHHRSYCILHKIPSRHNHLLKKKQTKDHDMELLLEISIADLLASQIFVVEVLVHRRSHLPKSWAVKPEKLTLSILSHFFCQTYQEFQSRIML